MELVDFASLLIRTANAVLWTNVVLRLLLVLVLGAVTPFGMPGQVARLVYTAFTAYAGIVALSILTTKGAL